MDRRRLLGVALLALVAVACGAESPAPAPGAQPLSADPSVDSGLSHEDGDLVLVIGRIPDLAGFE
jgi:hypothetical protein